MNTNELKRFAKEARIKLLDQVGRKLAYVLTNNDPVFLDSYAAEIKSLQGKIRDMGKQHLIDTVAYTWFNRLMALRFMDANGYTSPKVITPALGKSPEILQNALAGQVDESLKINRQRCNDLLDGKMVIADPQTEVYKMLLIASCNQWHTTMPFMFERISDYTELLLPDDLLSANSIVSDIRNGMSDEDCKQEELIGWLYQFYIADKKDEVFDGLKKNIKISAENIPAATQLFTPHWIVRYMVENTLGKLWLTLKPNSKLRQYMPYYIEAPEGNAPAPLPSGIKGVTDITFLDPCQGSGHVLVYAFDLFTKIYEEEGYNTSEIPALILEHNLFGIDIDERAAQLAAFALTMKARSYYSRFLRKPVQPHVIYLENVGEEIIKQAVKLPLAVSGKLVYDYRDLTLYNLTKADNFGSLIQIDPEELKALSIQKGSIWHPYEQNLKEQAEYLSYQYHCVVTNPPYKGKGELNLELQDFMESKYPKSKGDLFACFIERDFEFLKDLGVCGMVTMQAWLFIDTYKDLREDILDNHTIRDLIQIGFNSFPELNSKFALAAAFVIQKNIQGQEGTFISLNNAPKNSDKNLVFFQQKDLLNFHIVKSNSFKNIEGTPISFEASDNLRQVFKSSKKLRDIAEPRQGMATGDNGNFVRIWTEVELKRIGFSHPDRTEALKSKNKWFPYNKGGGFRKWYGNQIFVLNWENDGKELFDFKPKSVIRNPDYYFKECITWSLIGLTFGPRYTPTGFLFDVGGSCAFPSKDNMKYIIAFMASKISSEALKTLNPTLNYQVGDIQRLPIKTPTSDSIKMLIDEIITTNIDISKEDWNRQETAWDFMTNELIKLKNNNIKAAFECYKKDLIGRFWLLHRNEEELNRLFIEIYGLKNDLLPDVPIEQVTILQEEAKIVNGELFIDSIQVFLQLFSYSVGCMFGRYSLDKTSLILANQGETLQDFLMHVPTPTFMPDEDNIIPVLDGEWFTDDIVGRFKAFLKVAFGNEHFEENLKYLEDTIGKDIRKYFVKDFYTDHIKRYKKRPIYWMFSSPKGHFMALIYMHRYKPDLCSKLLTDYLQTFIHKLERASQNKISESLREDLSARDRTAANKESDRFEGMIKDCKEYAQTLYAVATKKIEIDLDDGVKVNYQKFKEVLVPIKGLEKDEE